MVTRCKFHCQSVKKFMTRDADGDEPVYEAEFTVVYNGSAENEEFFKWTPSGSLKIGVYKDDVFQPGQDYYVDLTEVAPK